MVPLCLGAAALVALERPRIANGEFERLDALLAGCLAIVVFQLIPLPLVIRDRLSPAAAGVERALTLRALPPGARPLSLDPAATGWALALGATYLAIFWSARTLFHSRGLRTTIRAVGWMGLVLTPLAVLQHATAPSLLYWYWQPLASNARPYSPFVNRNGLACWLAMALLLVIGYMAARRRRSPAADVSALTDPTQLALAATVCVMAGGLLASLSRAGIMGGGVGLAALFWLSRSRMSRGEKVAGLAASVVAMTIVAMLFADLGALAARVRDALDAGVGGRRAIWQDSWQMARDFWLTGVGAGAYERGMLVYQQGPRRVFFNHAHNEYLQLLVEGGVLFATLALLTIVAGVNLIVRRLRADQTAVFWIRAGAVAGILAAAVQSIWDTELRTPANGALFAVLAGIAMHASRESSKASASR